MPTKGVPPLDDVLQHIHASTLDPAAWGTALARMTTLFGARSAALFDMDWALSGSPSALATHEVDPSDAARWQSGLYMSHDLWSQEMRHLPPWFVTTGAAVVDPRALRRTPLYADIIARAGWCDVLSTSLARADGIETPLSFYGTRPFERRDVDLLAHLAPHLRLAIRVQRELGRLRERADALEDVVERADVGVVTLTRDAMVLWANRPAEALLAAGDGLLVRRHRLACVRDDQTAALVAAIAAAAGTDATAGGGVVPVSRHAGRRPYTVAVTPLRRTPEADGLVGHRVPRRATVLVTVTDPERRLIVAPDRLRQLLGLTPAEAALAAALAADRTLQEFADTAGVTMNTARWTLKQVLQKTRCRRQSELVALVIATAAGGQ